MELDEELMERVQRGDGRALEALIERHRRGLYAFLVRRMPASRCDDLFQETWLRVVRGKDRFDPALRFSTWLFQIANNLCRDSGRRGAVESRERARAAAEAAAAPPRDGAPPADLRLDVGRRLARLPERLREVLVLRYFEDLPEREIAAVVGVPAGTVKSRLHAAVRALRGEEERDDE
ncbi:MAG TPA: sigma-70 family RNA polymerase sigma factor [Myxococcota bacterium]|jgi:RNA polymerase sigma-70 factor (ECF subfamily)|nr:sigma-70 family RNA polymerase sigma factor [Myxococcota bacterium]